MYKSLSHKKPAQICPNLPPTVGYLDLYLELYPKPHLELPLALSHAVQVRLVRLRTVHVRRVRLLALLVRSMRLRSVCTLYNLFKSDSVQYQMRLVRLRAVQVRRVRLLVI